MGQLREVLDQVQAYLLGRVRAPIVEAMVAVDNSLRAAGIALDCACWVMRSFL